MTRQALTDGSGRWFDTEKCKKIYKEATYWNSNNNISLATNSQWFHESLYITASGICVLHIWSQCQGVIPSWTEITRKTAARWLATNKYSPEFGEDLISEHSQLNLDNA